MVGTVNIGNLQAQLGMNTAAFDAGIAGAQSKLKVFGNSLTNIGKSLTLGVTAPLAIM